MAPLYLGSTAISKVYKGSTELAQNYLGDNALLSSGPTGTDHFGIITYTGDRPTNAGKTGMGFQPDLVWIKGRSYDDFHSILDSTRGANVLSPDHYMTESSFSGFTFDSDGFTVGSSGQANSNGETLVAWGWKANGGTTTSNTNGSITSTVQANTTAGFSIVTYTGNNAGSATIGHGLDSAPQLIFVKGRNVSAGWPTLFNDGTYTNKGIRLNESSVDTGNSTVFFNNTNPSSTVFSVGSADEVNDGYNYVAYCWHSVDGYSKVGSYTGTGSTGLTVSLGFQARFIMVKKVAPSGDRWLMADTSRHAATNNDAFLDATSTLSERDFNCTNGITFGSDSFTINTTDGSFNTSGGTYIYLAFA
jgi:hypothetical protein